MCSSADMCSMCMLDCMSMSLKEMILYPGIFLKNKLSRANQDLQKYRMDT